CQGSWRQSKFVSRCGSVFVRPWTRFPSRQGTVEGGKWRYCWVLSLGFALPKLEGKTHRENSIVIVPVEVSRSDLDSPADGDCQSLPQMDSSDDPARGYEDLSLPTARSVLEMRVVHFDFRPELSIQVILKGVVPGICSADRRLVACRQGHAEGTLDIERSEALPVRNPGRDDSVGRSFLVLTAGTW